MSDDEIVIDAEDFRFLDVELELSALQDYWRLVERELPNLAENARDRLFLEWLGPNADAQEVDAIDSAVAVFMEYELPRLLRSPILVLLWAIYESAANQAADFLRVKGNHSLKLTDIKGKNELDALNKYFEHVLHFPLVKDEESLNRLNNLRLLRNAISHRNGRIDQTFKEKKTEDWKKIEGWVAGGVGISLDLGYLGFSAEFVERQLTKVGESLKDLIATANKHLE